MSEQKESALTAPADRGPRGSYKPDQFQPPLTEDETKEASEVLNKKDFVYKFPTVERRYADPPITLQRIGLFSFIPAKGAVPNENGVYGFAKLRGNYGTETEANQQAEKIIREVDSYHEIYHCYVGRPFPVTADFDKYVKDKEEIDIRKQVSESVSTDIKQKKADEKRAMQEIKDREKALREDVENDADPYDTYTTLRVKLAQVGFTYLETEKKKQEMKEIILKARDEIEKMDEENPDYKKQYMKKYMDARKEAGIKEESKDNFIMYLDSDMRKELGF